MKELKYPLLEKTILMVTSAFGLVSALAWNETVKAFFRLFYGTPDTPFALLTYALIVTLIAVIVTVYLGRLQHK